MSENIILRAGKKRTKNRIIAVWLVWLIVLGGFCGVTFSEPEATEQINGARAARAGNRTLYVGGDGTGNYTTIQTAINDAGDGGTVFVFNGTYYENIILNKSLSIIGNGTLNTTINGSGIGDVILVIANWVNISRITITNSGNSTENKDAGIKVDNANNCQIFDNNISSNNGNGIYLKKSINISIENNQISMNKEADICLFQSTLSSIYNNEFSNKKYYGGIELRNSFNNSINNNIVTMNSGIGIFFHKSNNNNIEGNQISTTTESSIYLYWSSNNKIINNDLLENNSGILLKFFSTNNNISGNNLSHIKMMFYISDNIINNNIFHGDGIDLLCNYFSDPNTIFPTNLVNGKPIYHYKDSSNFEVNGIELGQLILINCTEVEIKNLNINNVSVGITISQCSNINVSQCSLLDNKYGLFLHHSEMNNIIGNKINNNNYDGIYLDGSIQCNIIQNEIHNNNDDGIATSNSNNGIITNNNISQNSWAMVFLDKSNYNLIEYNNVSGNDHGPYFGHTCKENIIRNNNLSFNKKYGIFINGSKSNNLYHNSFIKNANQSLDNINSTFWNDTYPSGGNFWSDYTGVDEFGGPYQDIPGSDGIGDTPYFIDSDSQDRYPLMAPFAPTVPLPPQNPQAFSGDSFINLTWDVPVFDGGSPILNYIIYKSTTPNQEIFFKEVGNVLSFNDTAVNNGITYYYKISAKNAIGEGALFIEINSTPQTTYYKDTDNDKIPDAWEQKYGFNVTNSSDAQLDQDLDNLTNLEEFYYNTNSHNPDTDNDSLSDGDEIKFYLTNATNPDTDGDNFKDGKEVEKGTDPLDPDDYPQDEIKPKTDYFLIGRVLVAVLIIILLLIVLFSRSSAKKKKNE